MSTTNTENRAGRDALDPAPALPPIVSRERWTAAREELLREEKQATRWLDALAAKRRRLPMVELDENYRFDDGITLPEIFAGRRQLIIYHSMFDPGAQPCVGCSSFIDNIGRLEHLHARDTSFAVIGRAPRAELEMFRSRMGWTVPFYSTYGHADLNTDCGAGQGFGLSALLRDGTRVFQTYFTTARGCDRIRPDFELLDLTVYGRQETWEDSPDGWPRSEPYVWWRYHDGYQDSPAPLGG